MYECWAWISDKWVQGFDVGTRKGLTMFLPLDTAHEKDCSMGYYCETTQISYGSVKPVHKGSDVELINQTIRSV